MSDQLDFGMMYQYSSVLPNGDVQEPYFPLERVDVQRLWDTFATMTGFGADMSDAGLHSQVNLAERNGSKALFCFGFAADNPAFRPPESALLPGSKTRPTVEYLRRSAEFVLDFSVGKDNGQAPRIQIYELWNEPAIYGLYWDVGTIADLWEQSRWLYDYIKSRQPSALVLSPSLNGLDHFYGHDFAERYALLTKERGPACDAIAFHMYATSVENIEAQLAVLDQTCGSLNLPYHCTEYWGPWEAFRIMHDRGIRSLVWNGQWNPPGPYETESGAAHWATVRREILARSMPAYTPPSKRRGCL